MIITRHRIDIPAIIEEAPKPKMTRQQMIMHCMMIIAHLEKINNILDKVNEELEQGDKNA